MKAPQPKPKVITHSLHGRTWQDPFAWLRTDNWREAVEDPSVLPVEIKKYLESENAWYGAVMEKTEQLQKELLVEMKGRIQAVDESLPDDDGPWRYFERYGEDDDYHSYWRSKLAPHNNADGNPVCLIDFNVESKGFEYFDPGDALYSPDHRCLAWTMDGVGTERYSLSIRDLATGVDQYTIEDVYDIAWGDSQTLFYTRLDENLRPYQVYRHRVGTSAANDVMVFEEADERFYCSVWTSASSAYVFIATEMSDQSEVWFIPTQSPDHSPTLIEGRSPGLEYSVEHQGDRFLILTNADQAEDFKIVETTVEAPSRVNWRDWLIYQPGRMVLDVFVYEDWVLWLERENALPGIAYRHNHQTDVQRIPFKDEAYAISLEPLVNYQSSQFRFDYETPKDPPTTFLFDMDLQEQRVLKKTHLPSGHQGTDYKVLRCYCNSVDGAQVPMTILHHRRVQLDGSAPCWLTFYGAYGMSMPAEFSSSVLSLVDRGFVYVIAHIRGGQERGRAWYEAAKFAGKPRSVDDVIACAEWLIDHEYTGKGQIVIQGASAGGLVVGAALNRDGDWFGAAIADVPFVDALNTMLDESLPLTAGEWNQWGNPKTSKEDFDTILSYSPYDNIEDKSYPAMLVTAGIADTRVMYWEPAKWVARHRYVRNDDQLLLLRTHMKSGHLGETGRYSGLKDVAAEQAFAIMAMSGL